MRRRRRRNEDPLRTHSSKLVLATLIALLLCAGACTQPPQQSASREENDGSLASRIEQQLGREFEREDTESASALPSSSGDSSKRVERISAHNRTASSSSFPLHLYHAQTTSRSFTVLRKAAELVTHLSRVLLASDTDDVEKLVDHGNNEFVLSSPAHEGSLMLQQDLQLISDLIVLLVLAAALGTIGALCGQPTLTGYIAAGSLAGPGGLHLVQELVQIETIGQFGVVFLLFTLGMEFDISRLSRVRTAAVFGGTLQIALLMLLGGLSAFATGAHGGEGVFVGAFLSMSSTASIIKCLSVKESASLVGQITIGTLLMQDCVIGLLFAILPLLGSSNKQSLTSQTGGESPSPTVLGTALRLVCALAFFLAFAWIASEGRGVTRLLETAKAKSAELFQVALIALCLVFAFASELLGLSMELGAFIAGVVVTAACTSRSRDGASALPEEHASGVVKSKDSHNDEGVPENESDETTYLSRSVSPSEAMAHVEPIRNVFAALFLSSVGIVMNLQFLYDHCVIVLACTSIAVAAKAILGALVLRALGYSDRVSLKVGIYLAHVGEISFLLLSRASAKGLVSSHLYLLLLGTISLSLILTPLLVQRAAPAVLSLASMFRVLSPPPYSPPTEANGTASMTISTGNGGSSAGLKTKGEQVL